MQRSQDRPAPVQQGDELPAGQLVQRRHRLQVGVDPVEQVLRQPRQRGPQPAGAPRPPQPAEGRYGLSLCPMLRGGDISPASLRSMATWPSMATTTSLAASSLWGADPASRTASCTASRSGGTPGPAPAP